MPASKTRRVASALTAQKAMQLRVLGFTYEHIARECEYSGRAAAFHAVQRELERAMVPTAEQVRTLEEERLDALLRAMMPQALKGNQGAVDRVLRIMERRAKMFGLEIVKHEHSGPGGAAIPIQFFDATAAFAAVTAGPATDSEGA